MTKTLWKQTSLFIAAAFLAIIAMVAGPAPAQAADAKFENVGNVPILMCRDWTTDYGDGRNSRGTCKYTSDGGKRGTLYKYQTTPGSLGFADTDGFYTRKDHNIATRNVGLSCCWNRWRPWGWWKKRGYQSWYDIKQYHE